MIQAGVQRRGFGGHAGVGWSAGERGVGTDGYLGWRRGLRWAGTKGMPSGRGGAWGLAEAGSEDPDLGWDWQGPTARVLGWIRGGAQRDTPVLLPREMVLVVHGFPSAVAALRFEWAWQHPHASRRLAHVGPRLRGETAFTFHLRVLAHMLRAPPWARLPLTLRWLRPDLRQDLCLPPPPHVPLAFGPPPPQAPTLRRRAGPFDDAKPEPDQGDAGACCVLCARTIQDEQGPLCCPHPGCLLRAHMICLAEEFLQEEPGQLLPLEGQCPSCEKSLLWGDLICLCQMNTEKEVEDLELEEAHWTDLLET
ncbi:structure-specific endonuclease subunit SLX1 isoform X1 [Aotus nancymaae]|uniref:structure-specific endonuclease subunit SLX1 isoform X1 n=1 Tax=Aotus nancymaae TaxID=37293 RepID=UPI0030FE3011